MENNFLQSSEWREFQEAVGRKTYNISGINVIEHQLPIVGKYFYLPKSSGGKSPQELIDLAKNNKAGWIRIEPENEEVLNVVGKSIKYKISKAPHDMQPRKIFVIDITKPEEQLLAEMKAKTRYNIKLAQKHGVAVQIISKGQNKFINEFIRLTKIMAKRQRITAHPDGYYRKMFEMIPGDILKLYVAEYEEKIIAANIMVFYGDVCTYLHGASDDKYRSVMAPYLLQWQAIKDSKALGCTKYDFGGISFNKWQGITRFKTGFSLKTNPIEFPGSYDLIIDPKKYFLYKLFQKIKGIF